MHNTKNIIIILLVIFIIILIGKIIFVKKEGFTDNALDLLNKHKSSDVQLIGDSSSTDIELSINPWTTKLHNMQDKQIVKPVGIYKPHLVIKGEKYAKLGDMISTNADYSPSSNNNFILLIKKVGSDIKPPTGYNLIVDFVNQTVPDYYYQYDKFLGSHLILSSINENLTNCMSSITRLNNLIQTNSSLINTKLTTIITSQINLLVGNAAPINLNSLITSSISTSQFNLSIDNANILRIPSNNNLDQKLVQIPINSSTTITLPLCLNVTIMDANNNSYIINIDPRVNNGTAFLNKLLINKTSRNNKQISNQIVNLLKRQNNNMFNNITNKHIIFTTIPEINIFSLLNTNDVVIYLQELCNDILAILLQQNITDEFVNYLKLANNVAGVNSVLSALSTLQKRTDTDEFINIFASNSVLNSYASVNSNTLLGSILNIIITNNTFSYPSIVFTSNDLIIQSSTNSRSLGITNAIEFVVNNYSTVLLDNLVTDINININENNISSIITDNIIPRLTQLSQFQLALSSNTIDYFPLRIYEPIAPINYIALGHVFCNNAQDYYKIITSDNVVCIPSQCVREIRDWLPADKVFEYNQAGMYWAIYKNPYTGTFKAVNQPQVPDGKVCKVVACVAKCTAVDELQKADECVRKYYQMNKSINNNVKKSPDLVASTEEEIYLDKIKQQNDNIFKLKQRAQQMQINIDKADIINEQMNKAQLQAYVDTQKRNIDLIVKQLEKDNKTIKTNINIPINALNELINIINNLQNLDLHQKQNIINKIITNAKQLTQQNITGGEYNANLHKILKSCPQYDLTELVRKNIVRDVCYGCDNP